MTSISFHVTIVEYICLRPLAWSALLTMIASPHRVEQQLRQPRLRKKQHHRRNNPTTPIVWQRDSIQLCVAPISNTGVKKNQTRSSSRVKSVEKLSKTNVTTSAMQSVDAPAGAGSVDLRVFQKPAIPRPAQRIPSVAAINPLPTRNPSRFVTLTSQ